MPTERSFHLNPKQRIGLGAAALLAIGLAGGAGAMSFARPTVEMAPTVPTTISRLPATHGIVTVRGRIEQVYGDRFIVRDGSGTALVDAGPRHFASLQPGNPILVQGRFADGQLHARYLVDAGGTVQEAGPPPPPPGGPGAPPPPGGPGAPPPPGGPGAPPPPGGAGAPPPGAPGAAPPPPGAGMPPAPAAGVAPPPPAAGQPGAAPAPLTR